VSSDRSRADTAAREGEIGPRELERRDLEGAKGESGHGDQTPVEPRRSSGLDDHGKADGLGDADGGAVERLLEGATDTHPAFVAPVVVPRAPRPGVGRDGEGRIVDHGGGSEGRRSAAGVQSGQIHERLERGAGLPLRECRAVELARLIVTPTHEGANLAGSRVNGD
jgi:hypothetical protein